mmetsp:Transcript_30630/g.80194  ORF Transcript_30630/g.80194 Transcript_30630/m.80194 type:complete len:206 (+) Transcript_30630:310-927(+)
MWLGVHRGRLAACTIEGGLRNRDWPARHGLHPIPHRLCVHIAIGRTLLFHEAKLGFRVRLGFSLCHRTLGSFRLELVHRPHGSPRVDTIKSVRWLSGVGGKVPGRPSEYSTPIFQRNGNGSCKGDRYRYTALSPRPCGFCGGGRDGVGIHIGHGCNRYVGSPPPHSHARWHHSGICVRIRCTRYGWLTGRLVSRCRQARRPGPRA